MTKFLVVGGMFAKGPSWVMGNMDTFFYDAKKGEEKKEEDEKEKEEEEGAWIKLGTSKVAHNPVLFFHKVLPPPPQRSNCKLKQSWSFLEWCLYYSLVT